MGKWKQKVDEVILRNSVYAMHIKEYKAGEKKRRAFYNFAHLLKKKTLTSSRLKIGHRRCCVQLRHHALGAAVARFAIDHRPLAAAATDFVQVA